MRKNVPEKMHIFCTNKNCNGNAKKPIKSVCDSVLNRVTAEETGCELKTKQKIVQEVHEKLLTLQEFVEIVDSAKYLTNE